MDVAHPHGRDALPEADQQLKPWWDIVSSGHGRCLGHPFSSLACVCGKENKVLSHVLPRAVCRLSTPSLWINAVQEAPLTLNHLLQARRVRLREGHVGGPFLAHSPAQHVLQTTMAPVG